MSERDPKLLSLTRLAAARQADFGDDAQRAYLIVLADLSVEDVSRACLAWASRPRGEYEPAMPPAASIADMAKVFQRRRQEEADNKRRLAPPPNRPVSPERLANFKRDVEAYARSRKMR